MRDSINRPAGLGRRFIGACIDVLIVLVMTILVNSYIVTPLANNHFDLEVKETICADYQEQYYLLAQEYGIATYERDGNSFTLKYTEMSEDKRNELIDKFNEDERVKTLLEEHINPKSKELSEMYLIMVIISVSIPELIMFLFIPLFMRRSATIGQMIVRIGTVHKDDLEAKNFQIVLRFLVMLIIETILVIYFFNYMALLLSPLISLIIMALNNNRNCLHDMLSSTKVVSNDAIIFANIKEKNNYLNKKDIQNKKTSYDEVTQELRDNFQLIDEQEKKIKEDIEEE